VKQFSDDPDPLRSPIAQQVLLDNKMGALPPAAPYSLWHAKFDELIPHASAVEMIPTALPWLLDRFNGRAFHGNCPG